MAIVHSFAFGEKPEDLNNKSRGSYYDDKTVSVQANGTPENKVCSLLMINVAELMCYHYIILITGQRRPFRW